MIVPTIIMIATLIHSVVTMLWSAIIAEVLAFIIRIILLKKELSCVKRLKGDYKTAEKKQNVGKRYLITK